MQFISWKIIWVKFIGVVYQQNRTVALIYYGLTSVDFNDDLGGGDRAGAAGKGGGAEL